MWLQVTREAFAKYVKVVKRSLSEAAAYEAASTAGVPMDAAAQHGHHGRSGSPSLHLTNPGEQLVQNAWKTRNLKTEPKWND